MDILYLLIPLSLVAAVGIGVGIWWAIGAGQFDNLEAEGRRILAPDEAAMPDACDASHELDAPNTPDNSKAAERVSPATDR